MEALSEDEDADEEETEDGERNPITQEQLAAALQVYYISMYYIAMTTCYCL